MNRARPKPGQPIPPPAPRTPAAATAAAAGHDLHVEAIQERAAASEFTVAPHVHAATLQLFLAIGGDCEVTVDDTTTHVASPCLVSVPGGVAHGFRFTPEARGWVLSVAHDRLLQATLHRHEQDVVPLLRKPCVLELRETHPALESLTWLLRQLHLEYAGDRPGRASCLEHLLRLVLIQYWREIHRARELLPRLDEQRRLFYEFRNLVELNFARQWRLPRYLRLLGCSRQRLGEACRLLGGTTPNGIILERLGGEARRLLLFTTASAAEIGYRLGFQDPSYFTRFFRRQTGYTPGGFRQAHGAHAAPEP